MSTAQKIQQIIDILDPLTDIERFAVISNVACYFCFNCGKEIEDAVACPCCDSE